MGFLSTGILAVLFFDCCRDSWIAWHFHSFWDLWGFLGRDIDLEDATGLEREDI
jgi:hypothetical protein